MFDPSRPHEILTLVATSVAGASSPCLPLVAGVLPHRLEVLDPDGAAHPSELLLGLVAPPRWAGVLVAAGGTATHRSGRREPVLAAVMVNRAGHATTLLQPDGGPQSVADGAVGSLADACRRCLGLATPPPPTGPVPWRALWLDRVMAAAVAGSPDWAALAVLRLHPGTSWATLRLLAADRADAASLVAPEVAAWMDDGMFARHVLAELPDPATLRAELGQLLSQSTLTRLDRLLDPATTVTP